MLKVTGRIPGRRFFQGFIIQLVIFGWMSGLLFPPIIGAREAIRLTVGQGVILDFPGLKRVAVGDATIADVKVVAERRQVMVTGLKQGVTNLTVWLKDGSKISRLIRVFTRDPEVVARDVRTLLQDAEGVTVRVVGDKVVIEGEVFTDRDYQRVERAAELYPQIVNLVQKNRISLRPMVEIDVKIMEVARGLRKDFGLAWQNLISLGADWCW
jgi:pilus assembly protein CpaC